MLKHLAFAQCLQIITDRFLFVETYIARVGAHKAFVEDAAGKLVEVFFFQRTQHARADLGGIGDGLKRDSAPLALSAKFFPERSQGSLPRARKASAPLRDAKQS